MNEKRRQAIRWAMSQINTARAVLEQVRDIEQGIYDNLPENLSMGDKAEKTQEGISTLDDAIIDLESIDMNLTEAFGEPTGREKEPTQMQLEA